MSTIGPCFQSLLLCCSILLLASCASNDVSSISAEKLAEQLATGATPLIIDSRSQSEYDAGHIAGALHLPFWQAYFADDNTIKRCQKETTIIYCEHGPRATLAGFGLRLAGCPKLITLDGHLSGWRSKGLALSQTELNKSLQQH